MQYAEGEIKVNRKALYIALAGIMFLPSVARLAGIRTNLTDSAPRGIWITNDVHNLKRGMLVSICPPESEALAAMKAKNLIPRGDCPLDTVPLLKAIGAVQGDTVTVNRNSVSVNGEPIPNTSSLGDIRWKDGTYRVGEGEVWIFSTYVPNSFDSRYFGPVKTRNINAEAFPVLVDGEADMMRRGIDLD